MNSITLIENWSFGSFTGANDTLWNSVVPAVFSKKGFNNAMIMMLARWSRYLIKKQISLLCLSYLSSAEQGNQLLILWSCKSSWRGSPSSGPGGGLRLDSPQVVQAGHQAAATLESTSKGLLLEYCCIVWNSISQTWNFQAVHFYSH